MRRNSVALVRLETSTQESQSELHVPIERVYMESGNSVSIRRMQSEQRCISWRVLWKSEEQDRGQDPVRDISLLTKRAS